MEYIKKGKVEAYDVMFICASIFATICTVFESNTLYNVITMFGLSTWLGVNSLKSRLDILLSKDDKNLSELSKYKY